jgi:HEPN domain-containing protein
MRREFRSFIFIIFIALVSASLLTGCAKPPTQEVEKAEKAIADAKQKEADLYVQEGFRKAEETLKKAKELIAVKKYKEAKAAAEESANSALMAVSLVETNKTAMKEEAEKMVQEIQQSLDEIKSLAAAAIKKKASINKDEIQGAIGKYELDIVSVKDQLQEQKIRGAYDQLIALKEQTKGQKEGLTAVLEKKQEAKK